MTIFNDFRRFLRWFGGLIAIGILLLVAFVVWVDPYNLYGGLSIDGINAVKPGLSRYMEEIKLTQAVNLNPDTLIFGNSRTEIGFDPESPSFKKRGYSAYNLAIRGTTIALAHRQLQYLIRENIHPKRLMIGLDFVDFMNAYPARAVDNQQKLEAKMQTFPVDHWFWRFDSLFSMTSIKDAIRTLLIQNDTEAETVTARGFNPLREYQALARNEGYAVLFRQRAQENAQTYLKKAGGALDGREFGRFRAMLESAASTDVSQVILIIYPYHAQILALFEETGLWSSFEQWKQTLVAEIAQLNQKHPNTKIMLIDFSGYGTYQCEPIPADGDLKSVTQWYWELGHFKKALGDIVIENALSLAAPLQSYSAGESYFGVRLDETNQEVNRKRIAQEKEACNKAHPDMFDSVKALASRKPIRS